VTSGREYWYGRRTPEELNDSSLIAGDGVRVAIVLSALRDGEGVRDWDILNC